MNVNGVRHNGDNSSITLRPFESRIQLKPLGKWLDFEPKPHCAHHFPCFIPVQTRGLFSTILHTSSTQRQAYASQHHLFTTSFIIKVTHFLCAFFVFSISSFLIRNRNYDYVLADSTFMQIRNTSTNSIITMMDIISIIISRSFTLLHSNNISIKLMHRMIDKVSVVVAASALLFNDFRRHFQCTAHCPCFTVS